MAFGNRGNGHHYQALDYDKNEIRVLRLSPGTKGEPIECKLVHTTLDMPLPYRAISYTWGDPSDLKPIVLDDRILSIGRNAFDVLEQLRSPSEYQNFWIDAICINQSDNSEKNNQVGNMRSVYFQALSVEVWLGRSQNESHLAFPLIRKIYRLTVRGNISIIPSLFKDPDLTPGFLSIAHLFARDFWTRVWVIQEVNIANQCKIHCGADTIAWKKLLDVSKALCVLQAQDYIISKTSMNNTFPFEMAMHLGGGPRNVALGTMGHSDAVWRLASAASYHQRHSCCTDPRDKIYAQLGIASAEKPLSPDYDSSVYDVYTKFVQYVVMRTRNLDIICNNQREVNTFSLPSWVPDW
jgi:hypothetical protein